MASFDVTPFPYPPPLHYIFREQNSPGDPSPATLQSQFFTFIKTRGLHHSCDIAFPEPFFSFLQPFLYRGS